LIARRCFVAGRVQGVFYRASARQRATELGVTGHARNLADGRVEVVACGPREAVEAFCAWLWQGPPAAHVTSVDVEELAVGEVTPWPESFRTS
jgi:acylphosphatase